MVSMAVDDYSSYGGDTWECDLLLVAHSLEIVVCASIKNTMCLQSSELASLLASRAQVMR